MILWHKSLIKVLPTKILEELFYNLRDITLDLEGNRACKVPYVKEYDISHFLSYAYYIKQELEARGCKILKWDWYEIVGKNTSWNLIDRKDLFYNHHTKRYLEQCRSALMIKFLHDKIDIGELSKVIATVEKEIETNE